MSVKIKEVHCMEHSDQRVEISLTNGQELTLMVNPETGKVCLLSNEPYMIGKTVQVIQSEGPYKGMTMHLNMVDVSYYGHPFED